MSVAAHWLHVSNGVASLKHGMNSSLLLAVQGLHVSNGVASLKLIGELLWDRAAKWLHVSNGVASLKLVVLQALHAGQVCSASAMARPH